MPSRSAAARSMKLAGAGAEEDDVLQASAAAERAFREVGGIVDAGVVALEQPGMSASATGPMLTATGMSAARCTRFQSRSMSGVESIKSVFGIAWFWPHLKVFHHRRKKAKAGSDPSPIP